MLVTILISLFTKAKPEAELEGLVYGLTHVPHDPDLPWYKRPVTLAVIVGVALVMLNVAFR